MRSLIAALALFCLLLPASRCAAAEETSHGTRARPTQHGMIKDRSSNGHF